MRDSHKTLFVKEGRRALRGGEILTFKIKSPRFTSFSDPLFSRGQHEGRIYATTAKRFESYQSAAYPLETHALSQP